MLLLTEMSAVYVCHQRIRYYINISDQQIAYRLNDVRGRDRIVGAEGAKCTLLPRGAANSQAKGPRTDRTLESCSAAPKEQ